MLGQFSELVMRLYRGCREQPVSEYRNRALERLKPLLPFDSGMWLTGSLRKDHAAAIHSIDLYNLPPQAAGDWARVSRGRAIIGRVMRAPGVTINCDAGHLGPELLEHSRRYGIEHLLVTASVEPVSGLGELILLYRADPGRPFSEEERLLQQSIVPHLAETWRINRTYHLNLAQHPSGSGPARSAVIDRKGMLHLVDPGFASLMLGEWPDWEGPALPDELAGAVIKSGGYFSGRTFVAQSTAVADLLVLRGRGKTLLDALSRREREIATLFAAGDTYKRIAELLSLSPATVRNHLNNIYSKLGVTSKAGLIAALASHDRMA